MNTISVAKVTLKIIHLNANHHEHKLCNDVQQEVQLTQGLRATAPPYLANRKSPFDLPTPKTPD